MLGGCEVTGCVLWVPLFGDCPGLALVELNVALTDDATKPVVLTVLSSCFLVVVRWLCINAIL